MKYNFDIIIDRRNTSCIKWDCNEQVTTNVGGRYGL